MKKTILAFALGLPFTVLAANENEGSKVKTPEYFNVNFAIESDGVITDSNTASFYPLFPGEEATVESNGVSEQLKYAPVNNSQSRNGKLTALLQAYVTNTDRFHVSYNSETCGETATEVSWTSTALKFSKKTSKGCTLSVVVTAH
ncbi:hypothetical protein [Pseudoalteromonas galatheae]|uniref:hypothetical protein n=1 Tax=Pseudoalteromonas galatheae TaxID=579562 RepID=UPI0030D54B6C